jgi:hypothetical protein
MRGLIRKVILWALEDSKELRALIAGALPPEKTEEEFRAMVVRALTATQYKHDPAPLDDAAKGE